MNTIENKFLRVECRKQGGEVTKITGKKNNIEFLWSGDNTFWGYHSPILFPIVGKVRDGKYVIDGKTFELPQHGLARLQNFEIKSNSEKEITFGLSYNEETLKIYPFKFELKIKHILEENSLTTVFEVKNIDNKIIYFGLGGHPAYNCPINKNLSFYDYYLEFSENENEKTIEFNQDGLATKTETPFFKNSNRINFKDTPLQDDTLVFKNLKSKSVTLKTDKDSSTIDFDFSDYPILAIWRKTDAPFICIEPWCNYADYEDFSDDFKNKEDIISLEPENIFSKKYKVSFNE